METGQETGPGHRAGVTAGTQTPASPKITTLTPEWVLLPNTPPPTPTPPPPTWATILRSAPSSIVVEGREWDTALCLRPKTLILEADVWLLILVPQLTV